MPTARLLALTLVVSAAGLLALANAGAARAGTPTGRAWVRAAHLVPGFGAARIDLAPLHATGSSTSVQMSPSASYGDVTPYQQLAPGTYTVTVRPRGSTLASAPVLSRSLSVVADKAYTLAALGTSAAPRLAALSDDLTPPAPDQARVRVLPAASMAAQVTVSAVGGPTIADGAVLGEATGYTAVPAGSWKLTTSWGAGASSSSTIRVASGSVYTLVVLDGAASPRLDLITDAAGTVAAPKGGAQTGGGGTASEFVDSANPRPAERSAMLGASRGAGLGAAIVLIGLALVVPRTRPVPILAGRRRSRQ